MRVSSAIWIYLFVSVLFFVKTEKKDDLGVNLSLSENDKTNFVVDSVYENMSHDDRLNLLIVNGINTIDSSVDSAEFLASLNGILVHDLKEIKSRSTFQNRQNSNFQNHLISIFSGELNDSLSLNNLTIGQTNLTKLAKTASEIRAEKLKKVGVNVLLNSDFQIFNKKQNNALRSFSESALSSEKFWQNVLEGATENGIRIGLNDPFLLQEKVSSNEVKEFHALGLSGLRYYTKKGHGILQISIDSAELQNRFGNNASKNTAEFILRNEIKFDGIIISPDFSDLPSAIQLKNAKESIENGCDLVCVSHKMSDSLKEILTDYFSKNKEELKTKVCRILHLKYDLFHAKQKRTTVAKFENQFQYQTRVASIVCLNNSDNLLPIKDLTQENVNYYSPHHSKLFQEELQHYVSSANSFEAHQNHGICFLDGFGNQLKTSITWAKGQKHGLKMVLLTDQNAIKTCDKENLEKFDAVLIAGDSTQQSKQIAIQTAFGAYDAMGKLPFYLSPKYPLSAGNSYKSIKRLAYVSPRDIGISTEKLDYIDKIALEGISAKAFPGCQIQIAWEGKVFYQKSFGNKEYNDSPVDNQTVYDIASITKIAASTTALMKLQSENKFTLEKTLNDYLPDLVGGTEFANIGLRDMMAHQAGLPAWIPFYTKTLIKGDFNPKMYSDKKNHHFSVPVAKDLWLQKEYPDTIYKRILASKLGNKNYLYSDLGYYFVKKIIERQTKIPLEKFVGDSIYRVLGLQTMTYNPYLKFELNQIAPTENDKDFRKQVVRGYVHDPGAAMLGGVGGHAGIFSTANDLAILMQMMLNEGFYGGKQIINKDVLDEYTRVQFPSNGNRRGAGFDKPNLNGSAATACSLASPVSFGHSGFTGTLTWADPKYNLIFVFLSNRVYPSAENWKIVNMNIRTDIQTRIYQAIASAENINFLY